MSNPEHFHSRAAAYRQLATDSNDEITAGDMFEIANLFNRMAEELQALQSRSLREPKPDQLFEALRGRLQGWLDEPLDFQPARVFKL